MKEELINKAYEIAKERYAAVGVDTEKVMETMQNFHLSLHCWQADDVTGFEVQAGSLTGGIQATGNYPGKARNIDELRADILKAASYIPEYEKNSKTILIQSDGGFIRQAGTYFDSSFTSHQCSIRKRSYICWYDEPN